MLTRIGLALLGVVVCCLGVVVAFFTWSMLPEGRYPIGLAGIPALPLVLLAWFLFKKAGVVSDQPGEGLPGWALLPIGFFLLVSVAAVGMFLADHFGLL